MTAAPLHPADAFLLGYLPHLVREQFDALDQLTIGREGAAAPLVEKLDAQSHLLPQRGPEVVSCVWEIEGIIGNKLTTQPPPPPRTAEDYVAWRAAVAAQAARLPAAADPRLAYGGDGSLPAAYALGDALGAAEHLLFVAIYANELLVHQPTHGALAARVADHAGARGAALDALAGLATAHPGLLGCPTVRTAVDAGAKALRDAPLDAPFIPDALGRLRAAYGNLTAAAREAEAALRFEPRAAIAAWKAGRLDGLGIRYAMLMHRTWSVPVALDDNKQPTPRIFVFGEKRVMFAFSDSQSIARAPKFLRDKELLLLRTRGSWVFSILNDELDVITLDATDDPDDPGTINYQQEQFKGLNQRAAEARVDEAFCDFSSVEKEIIRDYPKLWMAGTKLPTFPDGYGRQRIGVFTSESALEAATPPDSPLHDEQHRVIAARPFFAGIKTAQAVGFVINPVGPGRSRSFNMKFAEMLGE